MKAIVCRKYGSPDVLQMIDMDKPVPGANEVLIKVYASTVNRTDCALLKAKPFFSRFFTGLLKPKNPIPGTEFAGKIEAVGENESLFKVGDKVFGFDDSSFGSQGEYKTISEDRALAIIPDNIEYDQAAASTEGIHYAYNFINKVKIESGQKILVNGATGAIGSAAVQLLKYYGTDVTAVCNTKNLELVKSLGAARVIDYTKNDFTKESQKYSYIFDTVGKSSFAKCKHLLERKGVYISSELGFMSQNIFYSLFTPIFGKKIVKFPLPLNSKGSVLLAKRLIEENHFKAVIDKKYPLVQIIDAYKYVEKGGKTGSVVITVQTDD